MLKKFRNPLKSLLFPMILLKTIFFCKEKKKNEENKNNLNFRIVDEKNEKIKRFVNVNYHYSFF